MQTLFFRLLSVAILVATVLWVEIQVGWIAIAVSLGQLPVSALTLMTFLTVISYVLRAFRILAAIRLQATFLQVFQLSANHNFWNVLLPMRSGELAFPLLLKRQFSIDYSQSVSNLLLFRCLDMLALISIGLAVYWQQQPFKQLMLLASLLAILVAANIIKKFVARILVKLNWQRTNKLVEVLHNLPTYGWRYAILVVISFLIWASKLTAFAGFCWLVAQLPASQAIISIVAADLSSVLPIHGLAGSGTFEAAFVLAGQLYQRSSESLLALAVQLHVYLLVMAILLKYVSDIAVILTIRNKH